MNEGSIRLFVREIELMAAVDNKEEPGDLPFTSRS